MLMQNFVGKTKSIMVFLKKRLLMLLLWWHPIGVALSLIPVSFLLGIVKAWYANSTLNTATCSENFDNNYKVQIPLDFASLILLPTYVEIFVVIGKYVYVSYCQVVIVLFIVGFGLPR